MSNYDGVLLSVYYAKSIPCGNGVERGVFASGDYHCDICINVCDSWLIGEILHFTCRTRFGMLYVYSFLLAAPFVLMIFDGCR